jgi:folate-binding protein YgfZ
MREDSFVTSTPSDLPADLPVEIPVNEAQTPNPLRELHRLADAEFQQYAAVEIVCTFGYPQAEYSALHKGAALLDLPQRGILEVSGKDRLDFLNRLLTNQIIDPKTKTPLPAGSGVYAFLLNNKGRILADMNVLERGDKTLLETEVRLVPVIEKALAGYLFSEKVTLNNRIGSLHQIALEGPRALEILRQLAPDIPDIAVLGSAATRIWETDLIVWRDDPAGVPGYFLILPIESAAKFWRGFVEQFSAPKVEGVQPAKRQAWPTGWAAFNAARIEAGRAMFGIDFDGTVLPGETGLLDRAVSFTKGCYVGQEIVARMQARQQVPRQIAGIKMELDALPIAGASIFDVQQNRIGQITSSTISPILSNAAICLGMLKKPFFVAGTKLLIAAEGQMRTAHVVELPFHVRNHAGGNSAGGAGNG